MTETQTEAQPEALATRRNIRALAKGIAEGIGRAVANGEIGLPKLSLDPTEFWYGIHAECDGNDFVIEASEALGLDDHYLPPELVGAAQDLAVELLREMISFSAPADGDKP